MDASGASVAAVAHLTEASFPFTKIWSLYPAISGQAIPSAFGHFRLAETIRPEDNSYNDSKLLDLALYIEPIEKLEDQIAEVGIELKWTKLTQQGRQYQNSFAKFLDDFSKIKNAFNPHKYILQLAIADINASINIQTLNEQVHEEVDGRSLRKFFPKAIKITSFLTLDQSSHNHKFVMILWSIEQSS